MTQPDPELERAMSPLKGAKAPEPNPAFVEALRERLREAHAASQRRTASNGRRRWTLPLAGGALAVAAVLALMLIPTAAVTFADARARLRSARTLTFNARLVIDNPRLPRDLLVVRVALDQAVGVRSLGEVVGAPVVESATRWDGGGWTANHLTRRWAESGEIRGVERWLRELDPARLVLDVRDAAGVEATPVDEPQLPELRTFRLSGEPLDLPEGASLVLRVDSQTRLPVELVYELPPTPQGRARIVVDGFVWDASVDASHFAAPTPDDGWQRSDSVDELFPEISRETLVGALKGFARLSGGYYPGHRNAEGPLAALFMAAQDPAMGRSVLAALGQADEDALGAGAGDLLGRLIAGGLYVAELARRGAEPVYHGARVTAREPGETLLTWRDRHSETVRILGSLEISVVETSEKGTTTR